VQSLRSLGFRVVIADAVEAHRQHPRLVPLSKKLEYEVMGDVINPLTGLLTRRDAPTIPNDLVTIRLGSVMGGMCQAVIRKWIRQGVIARYGRKGFYQVSMAELIPIYRAELHPRLRRSDTGIAKPKKERELPPDWLARQKSGTLAKSVAEASGASSKIRVPEGH